MDQRGQQRQEYEQPLIDHPNVLSCWFGLRLTKTETLQILYVESDLVLDTKDDSYDARAVESLIAKVREFHAANSVMGST
jgi:hypothetical protein